MYSLIAIIGLQIYPSIATRWLGSDGSWQVFIISLLLLVSGQAAIIFKIYSKKNNAKMWLSLLNLFISMWFLFEYLFLSITEQ